MTELEVAALGALPTLLAAKFLPPLERDSHVRRERLHRRLSRASTTPVTLVSAPAGFGKTTLVAAWLDELPHDRWAWLSLDERDNDPVRMWAHVIEALRTLSAGVGERSLSELVRTSGQGAADRWIDPLLNELFVEHPPTSYLVIDDFHVITDAALRASVALFAGNLPAWLRLIFVTRADPPLPLPRLRAEGRLTEIRQVDLRFDNEEAMLLFRAEGIDDLDDDQLTWLMGRTEGWAAGLQLAVIVLGDDTTLDRLQDIVGSNGAFADYIVSEVVDVASDDLRRFLFTTAVLDRFSPSLAQAVSGLDDVGRTFREALQRGMFLVALDENGEWFRYHQLFAEAIHAEARSREPELVRSAHENAAVWFERHGDLATALDHWLAADRLDDAFRIVLDAGYHLIDSGQVKSMERITGLIPPEAVGPDPHRQLDYAMLHLHVDADVCRTWVDWAAKSIDALEAADDELERRMLTTRAMSQLLLGEWDEAAASASASIDQRLGVGEGDTPATQRAGIQLLRAKGWAEEPAQAEEIFRNYIRNPLTPPIVRNLIAPSTWALGAAVGGRIRDAERSCSKLMAGADGFAIPQIAHQELLLARLLISAELADIDSALAAIDELRSTYVRTYHSLRAIAEVELALGLASEGHLSDASRLLEDITQQLHPALGPRVLDTVDRGWTELHLCNGDLVKARESASRMRVGFWRDTTRGKVLMAAGEYEQAMEVVQSVTTTSPRQDVVLLLLRANSLAHHDHIGCLALTEEALTTASTNGMLQTVASATRGFSDVVEPASSVVPEEWMDSLRRLLARGGPVPTTGRVRTLYEQPTERERTVARYLPSRLTVSEIARELDITPNTLKSHLKSLYRKLGVTSHEEAVATARRLGIIGSPTGSISRHARETSDSAGRRYG